MTKKAPAKKAPAKKAVKKAPVKKAVTKKSAGRGEVRDKLDRIGIDAICLMFEQGKMQNQIARELGINDSILLKWLAADEKRSARARESRGKGAFVWDELAMEELQSIPLDATPAQIARAREMAQHYRWRATKLGRADYGEKVDMNHSGSLNVVSQVLDDLDGNDSGLPG